jgi:hypothetical protein
MDYIDSVSDIRAVFHLYNKVWLVSVHFYFYWWILFANILLKFAYIFMKEIGL